MRIFAFSDWRVQPLDTLVDLINDYEPDAVLYAGDDLDRFIPQADHVLLKTSNHLINLPYPDLKVRSREDGKALTPKAKRLLPRLELGFSSVLDNLKAPVYLVNGNDDSIILVNDRYYTRLKDGQYTTSTMDYRIAEDADKKVILIDPWLLFASYRLTGEHEDLPVGSGIYASIQPSFGEFKISKGGEEISVTGIECQYGLRGEIVKTPKKYTDIYLSHLPPLGALDLSRRFGIDHIGSKKLLSAVKRYAPKLVVCGHSHMWGGHIVNIGETMVLNISSHDNRGAAGNYALIDTSDWSIELKATERNRVFTIPGMRTLRRNCMNLRNTEKLRGLYGDNTTDLLASLDYIETRGINATLVRERVKSLSRKKPRIKRSITFDPHNQAYVDVETGLARGQEPGELWLVVIWYDGEIAQFIFPEEKRALFKYIKDYRIDSLASWTMYDANALRPVFSKARIPMTFIDACQRTRNCVVWNTYRLHDLYDALFATSSSENLIDGFAAGLYADHVIIPNVQCPYCPSPKEVVEQIKERNRADIQQMVDICVKLWEY